MFYPDGKVTRKISSQEMCQIFDYPTDCFSKITEQEEQLLTENNISGKVVLDAIYFLDKFENTGGMVPAPGGVSVALALANITEERKKRKGHARAKSARPQKQHCGEGNLLGGGQKKSKGVVDDKFLSTIEDRVERPNIAVLSKVKDVDENDRVVQCF